MMQVELTPSGPVVSRQAEQWRRSVGSATRLAVSTATRQTGSEARRVLRDKTALPFKRLRRRVFATVRRAGSGYVWVGLNAFPAGYFTPLTPKAMSPEQQADLPGSFARDFFFAGAFVARMPSGHLGIFKRSGRARLPIVEQTISRDALGLTGIENRLEDYAGLTLQREFIRQLERKL